MKRMPLLCLLLTACQAKPSKPVETAEQKEIRKLESDVRMKLKDPDSAKFQGTIIKGEKGCTTVNAKNSYGGYDGYKSVWVSKIYGKWDIIFFDQLGYEQCVRVISKDN